MNPIRSFWRWLFPRHVDKIVQDPYLPPGTIRASTKTAHAIFNEMVMRGFEHCEAAKPPHSEMPVLRLWKGGNDQTGYPPESVNKRKNTR